MDSGLPNIGGKVFILGEYLALSHGLALLVTLQPYFQFEPSSSPATIPPQSPRGRLQEKFYPPTPLPHYQLKDPYHGVGGLGASTAEFILHYLCLHPSETDPWNCWDMYQQLHQDETTPPSGCDLLAQWAGGVVSVNTQLRTLKKLPLFNPSTLYIFSAAHKIKTPTHTHLKTCKPETIKCIYPVLEKIFQHGLNAWIEEDPKRLGDALTQYGEFLATQGFEHYAMSKIKKNFLALPGVLGAKGSGAMQSDLIIILWDAQRDPKALLGQAKLDDVKLLFSGKQEYLAKGILDQRTKHALSEKNMR